ncbi:MAG: hypothetical protein Q9N34_00510 [Aquificota bacterium]|nr:hypothetical protein [Aquificota bacterium]
MFAVEHWGVEPDIMALAKAIGGSFAFRRYCWVEGRS